MEFVGIVEKTFAAAVGLVCVVLLARQFIGASRRRRLDGVLRRAAQTVHALVLRVYREPQARRAAKRQAEEAIRRARLGPVERNGTVVRLDSLRKPRKLH
jgi:hypothetical protein